MCVCVCVCVCVCARVCVPTCLSARKKSILMQSERLLGEVEEVLQGGDMSIFNHF